MHHQPPHPDVDATERGELIDAAVAAVRDATALINRGLPPEHHLGIRADLRADLEHDHRAIRNRAVLIATLGIATRAEINQQRHRAARIARAAS